MAGESGVAPLDSLKCTPSSLPDLRGADVATTSEGDCSEAASDRSAARTLSRNSSADGGALVADDGTRVTDALLLTTPLTRSGGASTDTAGPVDETDQLLPSSSDSATASQPITQHSAQIITAALVRQASIDNAKQRAASVNRDGLAGTSLHTAATTCSSDDDDSDDEKNAVPNTAEGSSCRWWRGRQDDRLKGHVLLLGGMLLAATVYIRLMQEDLECLDVPIWRWTCLGSVTFLGHALSRLFYWMVKSVLSRQNVRLFAYYTLASEVRSAGLLWFRMCIQGSAIAILLRDYPEDSETWNLAYVWIVRIMSWLLMLQTCRVMERVFLRWMRAQFQGSTFFEQMQQALNDEYVIRCLTPSRSGRLRAQKGDLMPSIFKTKLRRSDPRAVNAMAKYAVASNLSFGTLGNSTTNNDAIKISSKKSARLLATAVYYALKQADAVHLTRTDVETACGGSGSQLSVQAWQLLTRGTGSDTPLSTTSSISDDSATDLVDLRQVRQVFSEIYARRDNLAQSLMNANSIADALTSLFSILPRILLLFGALWTLEVDVYALWITFSSSLVALGFVFGDVAKDYFESAVFLFSVHPYDIGDWITLDGNWYCVRRIDLKHTLLEGIDKKQSLWANAVLRSKHPLENLTRSRSYTEQFTVAVDITCFGSGELVSQVSAAMRKYIDARSNVFSGVLWVMNTGPVDKVNGTFSGTTRTEFAGMKMGLSLRIEYAPGVVLQRKWYDERSSLLDAWCVALANSGATFSCPCFSSASAF